MYLAIDVGGTKTLLAVFSDDGKIEKQVKFPTPDWYPTFIDELKKNITELCGVSQPKVCVIAMPGIINRTEGIVERLGNLAWENIPIVADLGSVLACPITLENDAKLAGLAEADTVKNLYHRVLYVTVSTGIGLGLVVDGALDYSVHDIGGKGIMLEHQGKIMAWEEFASGKAIVRQTGKMASEITDEQDWYLVARNIAIGLINLIVTLSPDCIVIGGGVGSHLPKFQQHLHEELEIYRSTMIDSMPQIVQARHPEEAVVYGGYLLAVKTTHRNE
jgi:predicted NBD/HSP70 family sugar kinase